MWAKNTTSSDHWRTSSAWSTEPGMVPRTPRGWSRTSQPWQYGQCRRSRPHRSRTPGRSGISSRTPVVTSSRRARQLGTSRETDDEGRLVQLAVGDQLERSHGAVDDLDAVGGDLVPTGGQQLRGRHPVAGQEAVHVRRGRVAGSAGVDDGDPAPGTAQHQCCAQACSSATDDHYVVVPWCPCGSPPRTSVPRLLGSGNGLLLIPGTRGGLPPWTARRPWLRFWPRSVHGCVACGTSGE